jgi:hypothetical protein
MPKAFPHVERDFSSFLFAAFLFVVAAVAPQWAHALAPAPTPSGFGGEGAPMPGQEYWQRGFQEGMLGAMKDLENHRQPDAANREEYRHPHVPYEMQGLYLQGFRRGYDQAVSKLTGTDFVSWISGRGGEVRQQGFRDGVAGAIKDFGNKRRPDPENRQEFRHPRVPYPDQEHYRQGFQRGYRWAMAQMMGTNRG